MLKAFVDENWIPPYRPPALLDIVSFVEVVVVVKMMGLVTKRSSRWKLSTCTVG